MRVAYSTLKQHTSRAGRYTLLVLTISLIALGGLLARGSASPQDKFTIAEATTTEDNGKRVRARSGFKLVMKDKTTVVARRFTKAVDSVDSRVCTCTTEHVCYSEFDDGIAVCGVLNSSSCCKWMTKK